jgi:hypothetical protein
MLRRLFRPFIKSIFFKNPQHNKPLLVNLTKEYKQFNLLPIFNNKIKPRENLTMLKKIQPITLENNITITGYEFNKTYNRFYIISDNIDENYEIGALIEFTGHPLRFQLIEGIATRKNVITCYLRVPDEASVTIERSQKGCNYYSNKLIITSKVSADKDYVSELLNTLTFYSLHWNTLEQVKV